MNQKTLKICLIILAVCLLIPVLYTLFNRSEKREPTQQEIEANALYEIDWQSAVGQDGSDKEIILSLCAFAEEQTIGESVYQIYTSDVLGSYLYNFHEMTEIALHDSGILYVQYTQSDGDMIVLGYSDDGLMEKAVYDAGTDTLYHDLQGSIEVWTKFRSGIQLGEG